MKNSKKKYFDRYSISSSVIFAFHFCLLCIIQVNTFAQQKTKLDSIHSLLIGKWRVTADTNSMWVFDSDKVEEYYTSPEIHSKDVDYYTIKDTLLPEHTKKSHCVVLKNPKSNPFYLEITWLDDYGLIFHDLGTGRIDEFKKVDY
jgi:hypothetical protein